MIFEPCQRKVKSRVSVHGRKPCSSSTSSTFLVPMRATVSQQLETPAGTVLKLLTFSIQRDF